MVQFAPYLGCLLRKTCLTFPSVNGANNGLIYLLSDCRVLRKSVGPLAVGQVLA